MSVYYINSYDIIDPKEFSKYGPAVFPILQKYGAEVLASDINGVAVEGQPRKMNAIIRFPSLEAALECYRDPDYQPVKEIRQRSVENCTMVLVRQFS